MTEPIDLFHAIEGAIVILRQRGVFRQVQVYRRADHLYARWGAGFIQLRGSNGTTLPDCNWEALELPAGMEMVAAPLQVPTIRRPTLQQIEASKPEESI